MTLALVYKLGHVNHGDQDQQMFRRVVEYCGDDGVATDAILMSPRPRWLKDLVGAELATDLQMCSCPLCRSL